MDLKPIRPNNAAGYTLTLMLMIYSFLTAFLMNGIWRMEPVTRISAGGATICLFTIIFSIAMLIKKSNDWQISAEKVLVMSLLVYAAAVPGLFSGIMPVEELITRSMPSAAIPLFLAVHVFLLLVVLKTSNSMDEVKSPS
jgi:hypothetical protein